MDRIIASVEHDDLYRSYLDAYQARGRADRRRRDHRCGAAGRAHHRRPRSIVTYTTSGATALRAARERPDCPILGLTTAWYSARAGAGLGRPPAC